MQGPFLRQVRTLRVTLTGLEIPAIFGHGYLRVKTSENIRVRPPPQTTLMFSPRIGLVRNQ